MLDALAIVGTSHATRAWRAQDHERAASTVAGSHRVDGEGNPSPNTSHSLSCQHAGSTSTPRSSSSHDASSTRTGGSKPFPFDKLPFEIGATIFEFLLICQVLAECRTSKRIHRMCQASLRRARPAVKPCRLAWDLHKRIEFEMYLPKIAPKITGFYYWPGFQSVGVFLNVSNTIVCMCAGE